MATRKKRKTTKGRSKGRPRKGRTATGKGARRRQPPPKRYPVETRLKVVEQVLDGASASQVARAFRISASTINNWVRAYEQDGEAGLEPRRRTRQDENRDTATRRARHEAVVRTREEHPEWGSRRIQQVLARFEGIGVPETTVRQILHEAGLIEARPEVTRRPRPPRRFERARPNQLWQSDLFTFLLRRHERLYLVGFMDDHSRYLVGWALAHHQKSSLVMEGLRRAIAAYGPPEEMLTDNGRQYTAWRGTTEFERELAREGVTHIKSRPQHPQTLGKIERFWKTLWDEFLSRTVFADFADCQRRLGLFVKAYNFRRPHQGLDGLTPADRFFGAAPQVRAAIERTVEDNALRLAFERPTRKPFYLAGQLGDQDLTIAAAGSGLEIRMGDEVQTIELPSKEETDGSPQTTRFHNNARLEGDQGQAPASAATDPEVAEGVQGAGRHGEATAADDPERAQWGQARKRHPRGAWAEPWDVLPAGAQGSAGDAGGAGAGSERGHDQWREPAQADRGAGGEGGAARKEQAPYGAAAVRHATAAGAGSGDDGPWTRQEEAQEGDEEDDDEDRVVWRGLIAQPPQDEQDDEELGELLAELDELARDTRESLDDGVELAREVLELARCAHGEQRPDGGSDEGINFDPHQGWRGRAMSWERKLAGAGAPSVVEHDNGPGVSADANWQRALEDAIESSDAASCDEPEGMTMASRKDNGYTTEPEVPRELRKRYAKALEILNGTTSVSEAARALGLSRPRMQTIVHQVQAAVIETLEPKKPGPAPKSERTRELEQELDKAKRQIDKLEGTLTTYDKFFVATSDLLHERQDSARTKKTKKKGRRKKSSSSSDP